MRYTSLRKVVWVLSLVGLLLLPSLRPTAAFAPRLMSQIQPLQPAPAPVSPDSPSSAVTLYPSDDAPVLAGESSTTHGSDLYLGAGYYYGFGDYANGVVRSYLKFDLSIIPAGSFITSATLHISPAGGRDYPGQTRATNFYRVTGNWSEAAVTWNNRPGYSDLIASVSTTYDQQQWLDLDLTSQVRAWHAGSQPNYGLVLIGTEVAAGFYRVFGSGDSDHSPELRVTYQPPLPPVLDASPGHPTVRASSTYPYTAGSIQVSSVTSGTLTWTASEVGSVPWLMLTNASGSATATTPGNLTFAVDATALGVGVYTAQVRISSSTLDVVNSPLTATISLEVVDQLNKVYLPLVLSEGGGTAVPSRDIVALIIGIGDYQYLDPPSAAPSGDLPDAWGEDLASPPDDLEDFHTVLAQAGVSPEGILRYGGGPGESSSAAPYAVDSAGLVAYPLATKANVVAAFAQLDAMEDEDTVVIFYYSGHGGQTYEGPGGDESDGYDEFIAMYDTNEGGVDYVNVFTDDELEASLSALESEHIIVILDSCFSGSMMDAANVVGSGDLVPRGLASPRIAGADAPQAPADAMQELVGENRLIITAGTGDETTWESGSLQNGVFTYHFLQGLSDALNDANQNNYVSMEEAFWYTKDQVTAWVEEYVSGDETQHPDIGDRYFGQMNLAALP